MAMDDGNMYVLELFWLRGSTIVTAAVFILYGE